MKAWMIRFGAAVLVLSLFGANGCSPDVEGVAIERVNDWLEAVEDLPHRSGANRCSVDIGGCVKDSGDFDPNEYFLVFDHLSMEPGYTLDSIMLSDSVGRRPIVYARGIDERPFNSYPSFARVVGSALQYSFETIDHSNDYLEHVQVDGTPEGYFQYVALSIVDDQYQLYWHGLYNDTTIVTSQTQARELLKSAAEGFGASREEDRAKGPDLMDILISRLDFTPWVKVGEGKAIVRMITFTKWGGFYELRVTFSSNFPHEVQGSRSRLRVPYNCGVMY